MKPLRSIKLFAGAGGLALGLEKAGFQTLGLVEWDKTACQTLKHNRPQWNVICADIREFAQKDLLKEFQIKCGELDLLSGGPPCQSFSYAGKRLGLEDVRGTMFYYYAQVLKQLKPKMFLFENVKGLLSHQQGKTFETIQSILKDQGYQLQYQVLNAWDYDVAQKRERLILIGIRNDLIDYLSFDFPTPHTFKPILKDIFNNVPISICDEYSVKKQELFKLIPQGGYWRNLPENLAKEYMKSCWNMSSGKTGILHRLSLDQPCLTLLTTPQMKQTERCHPLEERPLSIRESARVQSFPDNWEFMGSKSQQYKQIGNAVPRNLALNIGEQIVKTLRRQKSEYTLSFIKQEDFEQHVLETINSYNNFLKPMNLKEFNRNTIDSIKLLFDKEIMNLNYEEVIRREILRQKNKSDNNAIGYFHQNIFKYISGCKVINEGIGVGCKINDITYLAEIKNKYNTMNSYSSQKTYLNLKKYVDENPNYIGVLVEVIAKKSQDIPWTIFIDR